MEEFVLWVAVEQKVYIERVVGTSTFPKTFGGKAGKRNPKGEPNQLSE